MRMFSHVLEWVSEKSDFFMPLSWFPFGSKLLREATFGKSSWTKVGLDIRSGEKGKTLKISMFDMRKYSIFSIHSPNVDELLAWSSNNWPIRIDLQQLHREELVRSGQKSLWQRMVVALEYIDWYSTLPRLMAPDFSTLITQLKIVSLGALVIRVDLKTDGNAIIAIVFIGGFSEVTPFALSPSDTEFFFKWMKENNPDL